MAVTLSDFDNIWASSSPLTPYSFTDANYKEGWNFIGSTPPSRQMWDFLQKNNDEKAKYIVDNYLALSGGTMTGDIILSGGGIPLSTAGGTMTGNITTSSTDFIAKTNNTTHLTISGGASYSNSASIRLAGGDETGQTGLFQLRAQDGVNSKDFIGKPSGELIWNNKPIMIKGVENGHGIQSGKVTNITVNANSYTQGSVTFSTPFGGTPVVTATYSRGYAGMYACVYNVSSTGFSYTLTTTRNTEETGQTIDWIAVY